MYTETLNILKAVFGDIVPEAADEFFVKDLEVLMALKQPLERLEYSWSDGDFYDGVERAAALTKTGDIIPLKIAVYHRDASGYDLRASALPVNRQLIGYEAAAVLTVSYYFWGAEKNVSVALYVGAADARDYVKQAITDAAGMLIKDIESLEKL